MRFAPSVLAIIALTVSVCPLHAQIVYSDNFQYGNPNGALPFSTSYAHVANNLINGMLPASVFSITPDLAADLGGGQTQHPNINSTDHNFFDHTFQNAEGLYMAVNGGNPGNIYNIATIAVTPQTDYTFSIFLNSWSNGGNPTFGQVEVFINKVSIGIVTAPAVGEYPTWGLASNWTERTLSFNSGDEALIELELRNVLSDADGNDYSIDDISIFVSIPEPSVIPLAAIGILGGAGYGYRRFQARKARRMRKKAVQA